MIIKAQLSTTPGNPFVLWQSFCQHFLQAATKAIKTYVQNNIAVLAVLHKHCPIPNDVMSNTDAEYVPLNSGRHEHAKPSVC